MAAKRIDEIIAALSAQYPAPRCELSYNQPHELLIAARLSAQCTDKRVNMLVPELFAKFTSINAFAAADVTEIERIVKPCGLFRTKAADIQKMCIMLRDHFGGTIPDSLDSLLLLPGVGRKTANLIVGELYGKPAIVADTHVIRLSNRLGLTTTKNARLVEQALKAAVPPAESLVFCHRLVLHGRAVCRARNPQCKECTLSGLCVAYASTCP